MIILKTGIPYPGSRGDMVLFFQHSHSHTEFPLLCFPPLHCIYITILQMGMTYVGARGEKFSFFQHPPSRWMLSHLCLLPPQSPVFPAPTFPHTAPTSPSALQISDPSKNGEYFSGCMGRSGFVLPAPTFPHDAPAPAPPPSALYIYNSSKNMMTSSGARGEKILVPPPSARYI